MAGILDALGFVVTRAVDRDIRVLQFGEAMLRFERFPRMDTLLEVEGPEAAIETAIRASGLPRESFNADRLFQFVQRFEARTGQRAAICDDELARRLPFPTRRCLTRTSNWRSPPSAWSGATIRLTGPGRLRLTIDEALVDAEGRYLAVPYAELHGGSWRTGEITLFGLPGNMVLASDRGLEHAWATMVERSCPLPELARSHRLLGSRRGGAVDRQAKFLAPLLQARRRLEEEADLDARVATLDAKALRERIDAALRTLASEAFPSSNPDRRGLEAELEEAMASLFSGMDSMERAAKHFRSAPDQTRFTAWRDWVTAVTRVYALADTSWASTAKLLPAGAGSGRRAADGGNDHRSRCRPRRDFASAHDDRGAGRARVEPALHRV